MKRLATIGRETCGRVAIWVALAGAPPSWALPAPLPALEVARVEQPIVIDGRLDEPAWAQVAPIEEFWQQVPREGDPPTEQTAVRIAYDRTNLYIGARLHDREPDRIVAFVRDRDNFDISQDDWFGFTIDPFRDLRNGFWFSTNPLGAQSDAQIFDEGRIFNVNWDGIWDCRTSRDAGGWTVEMRIPFFNLRFEPRAGYVMGLNIFRTIKRKDETVFSPFLARAFQGSPSVSQARELRLAGPIDPGRRWSFKPYVLAGFSEQRDAGGAHGEFKSGLDVKWGMTPGLTADFTLNTDFAQVEADDQRINLTRFPLFFPEKREFFLEGAGFFDFGIPEQTEVFFSRRIGLEQGRVVPLFGGARLQGRTGPYTLGVLQITSRELDGVPVTSFAVARLQRDLLRRSRIGAIFTSREADGPGGGNRVAGADLRLVFSDTMVLEGFGAHATTEDAADGAAGFVRFARTGSPWSLDLSYVDLSEGFEPQIGFVRRAGIRRAVAAGGLTPRPNRPWLRYLELMGNQIQEYSQDGTLLARDGMVQGFYGLPSLDGFTFRFGRSFDRLEHEFEPAPGLMIPPGDYRNNEAGFGFRSFDGRRMFGEAWWSRGDFYAGTLERWSASGAFKVDDHLTVSGTFQSNHITLPQAAELVRLLSVRARYSLSTTLFTSALVQWNEVTHELGINLRLDWIHSPGADLFVVYNENIDTALLPDEPRTKGRDLLVKLTVIL